MKIERAPGTLELCRALARASDEEVRMLLDQISAHPVEIVKPPATGLVMQTVSDCFHTDFHLGEILVTIAEVIIGDRRGWGMVMGDNGDRAVLAACLDAILNGEDGTVPEELESRLADWLTQSAEAADEEARLYGSTRVNFESMAEE